MPALSKATRAARDDLLRPRPSGHRFQPSGSDDVGSASSVPSLLCLLDERRDGLAFSRSHLGRELLATRPPPSDHAHRQRSPDVGLPESPSKHAIGARTPFLPGAGVRSRSSSLVTRRASSPVPTALPPSFLWSETNDAREEGIGADLCQSDLNAMDCMRGRRPSSVRVDKRGAKHDDVSAARQSTLSAGADHAVFKFSPRTFNSLRSASSGGSADQRSAVLKQILSKQ